MFQLNKDSKITFVRGAFLGDFLVCLPVIYKIISEYNIAYHNVNFIIFNESNTNPIKAIFGKNHPFTINTHIIHSKNIFTVICSLKTIKGNTNSSILYLPMWGDSLKGQFLKFILLKYIYGITKKVYGIFKLSKKYKDFNSQYLTPFYALGLNYNEDQRAVNLFNFDKKIIERNNNDLIIAIYPNSKLKMKIWSKEKYIDLIHNLLKQYKVKIYLVGSKEDREYNEKILDLFSNINDDIINLAGTLDIKNTLAFFKEIDLFIGNDGFPMHLAAMANSPIIGLFTYKNPLGCWDPIISNKMITIRTDVSCKLCYLSECKNPVCITETKVENVLEAIDTILKDKNYIHEIKVILPNRTLNKNILC